MIRYISFFLILFNSYLNGDVIEINESGGMIVKKAVEICNAKSNFNQKKTIKWSTVCNLFFFIYIYNVISHIL